MKKLSAAATAAVLVAGLVTGTVAAPAHAASSNRDFRFDPDNPPAHIAEQVPEQSPLGSAYTGSAPVTITLAVAATLVVAQLIVDLTPPLRQAVDDAAAQLGLAHLPGSSQGNRFFEIPDLTGIRL